MKSIKVEVGEFPSNYVSARIHDIYAEEDKKRMEWLNKIIAAEKKPPKPLYRRRHKMVVKGQPCSICGRVTGMCIAAKHIGANNAR